MRRDVRFSGGSHPWIPVRGSSQPHLPPPWDSVALARLTALAERPPRDFRPGEWLSSPESTGGICCIHRGLAGLRRLDDCGRLVFLRLLSPGAVHVGAAVGTGLQALTTVRATVLPATLPAQDDPEIRDCLIAAQQAELDECERRIVDLATLPAGARLARRLLDFSRPDDGQGPSGRFVIPISRRDLADLIGVRPETLARLLGTLVAHGYVQVSGRRAAVLDGAGLRRLALGGCDGDQKRQ